MELYDLRNIRHAYDGQPALTIDRLKLPADAVTGVVGPNGSGKSTLFSILGFLTQPTQGEIRLGGKPAVPFDDHVRGKVALLTQDAFLLKRSVYNNIAYGLKIRREQVGIRRRVDEALEMVGLAPGTFARRPWYALSGGESRRVALAARLALRPDVLLLDEPTASVDASSARMIKSAALHARQQWGTALIISSHDSEWLADISDHLLHLFRGRILGNGKQTLIFGPWDPTGAGVVSKPLDKDQVFEAHNPLADLDDAVAAIEARHMSVHPGCGPRPAQNGRSCLKGLLTRLSYEQSIGRISAAVLVGDVVFSVYLESSQDVTHSLRPGQPVWVVYDPCAVTWY